MNYYLELGFVIIGYLICLLAALAFFAWMVIALVESILKRAGLSFAFVRFISAEYRRSPRSLAGRLMWGGEEEPAPEDE